MDSKNVYQIVKVPIKTGLTDRKDNSLCIHPPFTSTGTLFHVGSITTAFHPVRPSDFFFFYDFTMPDH